VTHFNNQKFAGYVSLEDAKYQIYQALGIELLNLNGSSFKRSEDDNVLSITSKLKKQSQLSLLIYSFGISKIVRQALMIQLVARLSTQFSTIWTLSFTKKEHI
jgi:hypothetical protein